MNWRYLSGWSVVSSPTKKDSGAFLNSFIILREYILKEIRFNAFYSQGIKRNISLFAQTQKPEKE